MYPAPITDLTICAAWLFAACLPVVALLAVILHLTDPFAARDHLVAELKGVAFALQDRDLTDRHTLIRDRLTRDQALRLARRMRLAAEDRPEPLF